MYRETVEQCEDLIAVRTRARLGQVAQGTARLRLGSYRSLITSIALL